MNIVFTKKNRNLIVKIEGDIDHHTSEEIKTRIEREYFKNNSLNIVMDFSKVNFMDSSGIGMLIGRYKSCNRAGGKMFVASVAEQADKIFQIAGLYKIIEKYDTVNDVIKNIG